MGTACTPGTLSAHSLLCDPSDSSPDSTSPEQPWSPGPPGSPPSSTGPHLLPLSASQARCSHCVGAPEGLTSGPPSSSHPLCWSHLPTHTQWLSPARLPIEHPHTVSPQPLSRLPDTIEPSTPAPVLWPPGSPPVHVSEAGTRGVLACAYGSVLRSCVLPGWLVWGLREPPAVAPMCQPTSRQAYM